MNRGRWIAGLNPAMTNVDGSLKEDKSRNGFPDHAIKSWRSGDDIGCLKSCASLSSLRSTCDFR